MKTIKKLSMLFLATFVLASCSSDDDGTPIDVPQAVSIIQTAQSTANLSSLVAAIEKAGLVDALNGDGPFTVLAPTNEAFKQFLDDNDFADLDAVPEGRLSNLLLNHVISGNVKAADLIGLGSDYTETSAVAPADNSPVDVYFSADANGVTFNGTSKVTTADVVATNGTIHIVDAVIESTILAFAAADPNFSNLAAAVTDPGQEVIADVIVGAGAMAPITVFAPINSAFQAVLDSQMDWNTVSDIPDNTLNGILAHHATGGNNTSSTLADGAEVTMANQQNVTIGIDAATSSVTLTSAGGTMSNVLVVDVQAVNGVIHAIDTVLMPM